MIGSAACLAGSVPRAPLSPLNTPGVRLVHPFPGDASPPVAPLRRAVEDFPARHVLVVEDDAVTALDIQQLLRDCGYRVVGPATSAEEALRLVDRGRRPLCCALVGAGLPGAADLAQSLAGRDVPVAWLAPASSDTVALDGHEEPVIRQPFARHALLDAIERATGRVTSRLRYATPPPQPVWPRIFPQL